MMKYCNNCGHKLIVKYNELNEVSYYCDNCKKEYYDLYNVAVSMIVKYKDEYLLVKQYHNNDYVLVAGYVNKNESLEDALKRELYEETKLEIKSIMYNSSNYYERTNTLMVNFIIEVISKNIIVNNEIDEYTWVNIDKALKIIKPNSLALKFLKEYVRKIND